MKACLELRNMNTSPTLHLRSTKKLCVCVGGGAHRGGGGSDKVTPGNIKDIYNDQLPPWEAEIKWLKIVIILYVFTSTRKNKGDINLKAKEVSLTHKHK